MTTPQYHCSIPFIKAQTSCFILTVKIETPILSNEFQQQLIVYKITEGLDYCTFIPQDLSTGALLFYIAPHMSHALRNLGIQVNICRSRL